MFKAGLKLFIAQICELFRRENIPFAIVGDMRNYEIVEIDSDFGKVPTLSLESLIQMKSRAGREQDQKDVAALRQIKASKL